MGEETSSQVEDGRQHRLSTGRRRAVRVGWVGLAGLVAAATALSSGLPTFPATTPVASHVPTTSTYRLLSASSNSSNVGPMVTPVSVTSLPAGATPPASAEVTSLRTRTSRTYLVDGGYEAVIDAGSVNYQNTAGAMVPISDSLVASSVPGYAWQNKGNWYTLLLPSTLSAAPVEFRSAAGTFSFQLTGAGGTASVSGASITYANALPGLSLTLTAENDAVKETLTLTGPQSPTMLTYALSLSSGLYAAETAAGGVTVTGSAGTTEFSFDPPTMVDAAGVAAPATDSTLQFGTTSTGDTLTVSLNSAWLGSATRAWPVTVDPSVIHYNADEDCQIDKGAGANTNYCGSGTLLTAGLGGPNNNVQRSVLQFNVQNVIPAGAQVTHASLELYLDSASTTSYANVALYQLTQAWTTAVTWNDYNGSNAWTTTGGTTTGSSLAAQEPTTAGWYTWGNSATTQLVQNWLNGSVANDGLLLRAATETNNELYTFDSTRGTNLPELNVFYVNALGQGSESQQLTDRSGLSVNVANGNLVVTGNDVEIQGTGLSLSVERFYNSLGVGNAYQVGAFGTWLMGSGVDENLTVVDNHVDFQGPGGWDETFYSNGSGGFTPPPGANANLVENASGSYTLTYDATGEQLNFNSSGYLTSDVDRNGDTLTYTMSGTNLSSITDTQGRTITFAYGSTVGSNLITSITDPTGREWQYAYTSANGFAELTQYTDPNGKVTTYEYGTRGQIAEPGGSCTSPVSLCTTFAYNAAGEQTKITFPGGATQTTTYDDAGDVLSVLGASSTGATLTSFSYTYTNGSDDTPLVQMQTENDAVASNTYAYAYNPSNELTAATVTSGSGTSYAYTYDADGNMLTKTAGSATTTYAYNTADELCWAYAGASSNPCSSAPTGATTYSFDSDGNETGSSAGAFFSYNTKEQTTSITYGGTTLSGLTYTDQGQDNRISAASTTFDDSISGTAISTTAGSSTYYLTSGQGTVLGERIGSAHYYFLTNASGSVVAVINGSGQTVANRYGYDPLGNTTYASVAVPNPFGYAGGFTDPTGLIHFGARYYDPSTARWTQVDPEATGTSSAYAYSNDDPINATDPTGLLAQYGYTKATYGWGWLVRVVHVWWHVTPLQASDTEGVFWQWAELLAFITLALSPTGEGALAVGAVAFLLGEGAADIQANMGSQGEWFNIEVEADGWAWEALAAWTVHLGWFWANPYN